MVRSVCRPRWGQIQARGKSGEKSHKHSHNSANTHAISLPLSASCFQGLCHNLKHFVHVFRSVGIELCDITAHEFRSAGSGFCKNVKKFPGKIPITRRICVRFEFLFFRCNPCVCAVKICIFTLSLIQWVSRNGSFCLSTSMGPDPSPRK